MKEKYIGYSVIDFDEWLSKITLVIDTQEKQIKHILDCLKNMGVNYTFQKLESGDYTYFCENYHSNVVIERKNSIEEITQNFGKFRERFENEFSRTDKKVSLVIESGSYNDVIFHNYCSDYNSKSLLHSFLAFEERFNLKTYFVSKRTFTGFILKLLYFQDYYVKAQVKEKIQRADKRFYKAG